MKRILKIATPITLSLAILLGSTQARNKWVGFGMFSAGCGIFFASILHFVSSKDAQNLEARLIEWQKWGAENMDLLNRQQEQLLNAQNLLRQIQSHAQNQQIYMQDQHTLLKRQQALIEDLWDGFYNELEDFPVILLPSQHQVADIKQAELN